MPFKDEFWSQYMYQFVTGQETLSVDDENEY